MNTGYNVAIIGATGTVGQMFLELLPARAFPIDQVFAVASSDSEGKTVYYGDKRLKVQSLEKFDFSKADIAFFSAGSQVSAHYAPIAAQQGCLVIDNTAQFRMEPGVPLIVPEVNGDSFGVEDGLIANPNCSTIQMALALQPIYEAAGIEKIHVVTFQSVSGQGRKGMERLASETVQRLRGEDAQGEEKKSEFPPIAFNVLPEVGTIEANGYSTEEIKLIEETRKIFSNPMLKIMPTAVRVPVFFGHSEAVHIETQKPLSAAEATTLFSETEGVACCLESAPTPITHLEKSDAVFVGRVRQALHSSHELSFWVVADNVRKGAALNAIQIAELAIQKGYL